MKKYIRILLSIVMVVSLSFALAGCSTTKFDASGYVKSVLDASCKGEFKDYMTYTDSSQEEAQKQYDSVINDNMSSFESANLSDELTEKYRQFFIDLYNASKYEVKEAVETDSGYTVDVDIEPVMAFDGINEEMDRISEEYIDELIEMASSGEETPTDEEINEGIYERIYEVLKARIDNISYGEKTTVTVSVNYNETDKLYEIPDGDLQTLQETIIDLGDLL